MVYRGFLNRVYGILQLKYRYLVYHFLWISGIKYTWKYTWVYLDEFWVFLGILANFFQVYWYTTTPLAGPVYNKGHCFFISNRRNFDFVGNIHQECHTWLYFKISHNILSMTWSVSSPDETLRRELKKWPAAEYFWQTSRCFICVEFLILLLKQYDLEGEIKDAKMSSFLMLFPNTH